MATNPISGYSLPADLPQAWTTGQIVSPNGSDVGLTTKHGYNYLMRQVNIIQRALVAVGNAFPDLLDDTTVLECFGTCSTAASTTAKTVTVTGNLTSLTAGVSVRVLFTYGNTASSPTLNVNNLGAIAIQNISGTSAGSGAWSAGEVRDFVLTGSGTSRRWVMVDGGPTNLGNVTRTLGTSNGGTGLTSSPSMLTNLGSNAAADVFASSPRPGVTGTLGIGNGGTGAATAAAAIHGLINGLTAITGANLASGDLVGIDDVSASTGKKVTLSELLSYIVSNAGIGVETGSYVGTGTYGVNNKNSITFSNTPKLVIFIGHSATPGNGNGYAVDRNPTFYPYGVGSFSYAGDTMTYRENIVSISGKTMSWYLNNSNTSGPTYQLNENRKVYDWFAIG